MLMSMKRPEPPLPVWFQIVQWTIAIAGSIGVMYLIAPWVDVGMDALRYDYGANPFVVLAAIFGVLGGAAFFALRRERRLIAEGKLAPPPPRLPTPSWQKKARWIWPAFLLVCFIIAAIVQESG
jgi:hypothetical protein